MATNLPHSSSAMNNEAPRAKKIPTERTFHGHTFIDNYEWLRDRNDPDLMALVEAENAYTAAMTENQEALRETLVKETAARTREDDASIARRKGEYWYFQRTWEGKSYPAIYRYPAGDKHPNREECIAATPESGKIPASGFECVWDGNVLSEGETFFAVSEYTPSPDGLKNAMGIDTAGNEEFTLRISDIASGHVLDDVVENIGYGLAWSADSSSVFYTRVDSAWRSYQVWQHVVGSLPHEDRLIYEEKDEEFDLMIAPSRDGQWLVVSSVARDSSEVRLVSTFEPHTDPIVVAWRKKGVEYSVEPAGDHLLVIHNAHTSDFELATAPVRTSVINEWVSVMRPAAGQRISEVECYRDFAVVTMRDGGHSALAVLPRNFEQSRPAPIAAGTHSDNSSFSAQFYREAHERDIWGSPQFIPAGAHMSIESIPYGWWEANEVLYCYESLTTPPTFAAYSPPRQVSEVVREGVAPNVNPDDYVEEILWVTAHDGTQVPLGLARRKDLQPDGTHPGYIYGYGSYEVSNDPFFRPMLLSLLDRGIVVGWAHVRGGGEMGRAWYENGKKLKKKNTFTDFVESARWMVESGWVAPDRLAADGRSAGGLLMGAVANLAPELFRAIHAGVPFVDSLTTILKPELPLTAGEWEEWGNPITDAKVYEYMRSYAPTENIRPVQYPAILATTSMNDVRVSYVEPLKWLQLLRETTVNSAHLPILGQIEIVAGHRGASGRYGAWRHSAFIFAWLISQITDHMTEEQ